MVLRFDIAITETTKNCPTAVLFSLDIHRVKTQKHVWTNSICVAFPMFRWNNSMDGARIHWKCNTNRICPNVLLCFHSTNVEWKHNSGWTSLRCGGNCYVKTQKHLDNFQMFTPSSVLELHLSTIACWIRWNCWLRGGFRWGFGNNATRDGQRKSNTIYDKWRLQHRIAQAPQVRSW